MPKNGTTDERDPLLAHGSAPSYESSETLAEAAGSDSQNALCHGVTPLRGIVIVLALGVLIFFQASNISLLTTTQSAIASDLDAYEKASWFTSAYLVAMSSTAPLTGRLSNIFSPRVCIFASTMIFALGGSVAGLAPSLAVFLLGRAIAGVGAAGVFTLSIIVVLQLTSAKSRGLFIGLLNTGYTIGVAMGAVVAGALLSHTGWRALFWMQSPLACIAGISLFLSIPKSFSTDKKANNEETLTEKLARVDYAGAVTLTSSLVLLLLGLSSPRLLVLPVILGLLVLPIFILNEAYLATEPIIPVVVMKSRGTLLSCLATLGFMMARWTVLFYTPVYAIAVRGWSPATAGSILIPTNGGFALGGLLAGWLHIRRAGSFYLACLVTMTLFPIALLALAWASTSNSSPILYVLFAFANGFCTGAVLNYTLAHVLHLTLPETHFIVTSLLATFRGFAGSFGSAVGGGIFGRILKASLQNGFEKRGLHGKGDLIRRLMGSPATVASLVGADREVAVSGYVDALRGLFMAGAGLAILMILVQAGTGWEGPTTKDVEDAESGERT